MGELPGSAHASRLAPGTLLAERYLIERLINEGGMGAIYGARDLLRDLPVAVKLILSPRNSAAQSERFEREARLLREFSHPSIVSFIADGQTDNGLRFLVMEWLEGEDLASRLKRGPLSIAESILLLRRICEGLAIAHTRGVIHRDLKPANIFLVEHKLAQAKLIDFGVARRIDRSLAMTNTGLLIGTPEYMAPEQARGIPTLTCAADVFALGCVLYECLTGRPAFFSEHLATVLCRILFEDPLPIEQRCANVPAALSQLIGRMLRKDPAERPKDATEVAAALARIEPISDDDAAAVSHSAGGDAARIRLSRPPTLAVDRELLSIVLARARATIDEHTASTQEHGDPTSFAAAESLLSHIGARAHLLLEGTLIVTLPRSGNARDQVSQAARAALLLRERWPAALVAVLTGRGVRQGTEAVGDVVEAGLHLLKAGRRGNTASGALLDELSAQLLPPRFETQREGEWIFLVGEDVDADVQRPLLGLPTPCLGREVELSSLDAAFATCIEDREPQVAVVTGAAGEGKSRLRHEFLRRAAQQGHQFSVLSGRGEAAAMPYAILRQALRRYCQVPESGTPESQRHHLQVRLSGARTASVEPVLVEFMAELLALPNSLQLNPALVAARADPRLMRDQLRRAFCELLRSECQRAPLIIVLDDLQWCDVGTIDLIGHAIGQLRNEPLFVLGLGRPELASSHPNLWHTHDPRRIPLRRLGRKACERLIRQVLGRARPDVISDELIDRLITQSEGNALCLEELIRATADPAADKRPQAVLAMLQARISILSGEARHILLRASVLGPRFTLFDLAALDGKSALDPILTNQLQGLRDAELFEIPINAGTSRPEDEIAFRNDLIREAAYELILPAERAALHHQVARHLEKSRSAIPLRIAEHFLKAEERAAAILWLGRAAEKAFEGYDLEGTNRIVEQAVAVGASGETLAELRVFQAAAAFWQSNYQQCQRWALSALPALRRGSVPYFRLLTDALLASARLGDTSAVEALHRDAVATNAETEALHEQLICLGRVSYHWLTSANLERADALLARIAELSPAGVTMPPIVRAQIADAMALRAGIVGNMARYAETLTEAIAAFEEAGDVPNVIIETAALSICLLMLGQAVEAEALCRRNLLRSERLGAHQATGMARLTLVLILIRTGQQLAEAQRLLTASIAEYQTIGHRRRIGLAYCYQALLFFTQNKLCEALSASEQAVANLSGWGGFQTWALALRADILLRSAKPHEAIASARLAVEEILKHGGAPAFDLLPHVVLAESLGALQKDEEQRALVLDAVQRLHTRIAGISRPDWKRSYLAQPEQQRLYRLAERCCPEQLTSLLPGWMATSKDLPA